jgi:hypothetical protein
MAKETLNCLICVLATKKSLILNLEIGETNWHSTVIANNRDSAVSFSSQPTG